jgi:hypothetical protein
VLQLAPAAASKSVEGRRSLVKNVVEVIFKRHNRCLVRLETNQHQDFWNNLDQLGAYGLTLRYRENDQEILVYGPPIIDRFETRYDHQTLDEKFRKQTEYHLAELIEFATWSFNGRAGKVILNPGQPGRDLLIQSQIAEAFANG